MIPFPNISPEIFSLSLFGFDFSLRWYALSYIVGFFCAIRLMKYFILRKNLWRMNAPALTFAQAESLLTYLIIGVILGGRLGYVLFYNFSHFYNNPVEIVRIWDGGMAFHGGFIGVILAALLFCKTNSIPLWSGADLIAVSSPPGLFLGRLANFVNAELWGKPTVMPWGVVFPGIRAQDCGLMESPCARHPSQIYEAMLEGLLLFILLFLLAKSGAFRRPGLLTGVFAFGYGFSRFVVEYVRVPDPQFFSIENPYGFAFMIDNYGITMGQLLSLPMIAIGAILLLRALTRKEVF